MKLIAITMCLCLVSQDGLCVANRYWSDTCRPCIGSGLVQTISQLARLSEDDLTPDCQDLHELIYRLQDLQRYVGQAKQHLLTVFDNDDLSHPRRPIETPANLSWMEVIYNKLSFLHLNLKLIEMRPRCNVNINNIADRIPLCHVYGMMPLTEHFRDICMKEGHVPTRCSRFQIFASRVLETAADTLREILRELSGRHCLR